MVPVLESLTYSGQHITRVSLGFKRSINNVAGFCHWGRKVGIETVVLELRTPDELRLLSASRTAIPFVAHPEGQYRPGERYARLSIVFGLSFEVAEWDTVPLGTQSL
jgi:hypothetical protein